MVPKLHESFVLHDSWTKLNVMPAKIMQVSSQNIGSYALYSIIFSRSKYYQSC